MLSFRYKGKTIPYTNPSSSVAVASGTVIAIIAGIRGAVGIATDTIGVSAPGALAVEGVHEVAANSANTYGETGVQGQAVYWDFSALSATVVFNSSCTLMGSLAEVKNSGDTVLRVKLTGLYGLGAGAASNVIPDPGASGAIPVSASGICYFTSAGAESRTLAAPAGPGISLILVSQSVAAGAVTVNSAAANISSAGDTHAAFSANGKTLELLSIPTNTAGTYRWAVMTNDGVTLS